MIKKVISIIFQIFVGGLFIFSGLIKVNDPVGTSIKLKEYFEIFATDFAGFFHLLVPIALPIAIILVVLEVVLGVALLLRVRMNLTMWTLLLLIVFFTFLTFYSAKTGNVTDCGCFGDAIKLTPWESFTKDIILLVMIVWLFVYRKSFEPLFKKPYGGLLVGLITVVTLVLTIVAIRYLPFIDFRAYHIGANLPANMQNSAPLKYSYIMEKDGKQVELNQYPTEDGYTFKEMVLLNPEAQPLIYDYSVWNDEGDFTEQTFVGTRLMLVIEQVSDAKKESLASISALIDKLPESISPMILTSSGTAEIEEFRHEHQLAAPYYFADATVLKTMVRSNPGLILIKDGTVKGKWSFNAVPTINELQSLNK